MSRGSRLLRLAAFAAGVALVAWLVRDAGLRSVVDVMDHAARALPIVVLLEGVIVASDFWASRALVGDAATRVPTTLWMRATALAYASSMMLPAGRAAGEATRAATLSSALGLGSASAACTRLQAVALFANAIVSTALALALALDASAPRILSWALIGNAAACSLGGAALLLLLRNERFQGWLRRRFPNFVRAHAHDARATDRAPLFRALLLALFGRSVQTMQYGVAAHAVGGALALRVAVTAQGIHLVGAALGDAVPNQLGATEGAYRLFARALDMEPSQALSIAFVVRAAQLLLALPCLAIGFVAARQLRPTEPR